MPEYEWFEPSPSVKLGIQDAATEVLGNYMFMAVDRPAATYDGSPTKLLTPVSDPAAFGHLSGAGKIFTFDEDAMAILTVELWAKTTTTQIFIDMAITGTGSSRGVMDSLQDNYGINNVPAATSGISVQDMFTFPAVRFLAGDTLQLQLHAEDPTHVTDQGSSMTLTRLA